MTKERATSEVMQIYGYLSPDKQQALDVLIQAISKAEYEARVKADMIAMLEDLDLQIDESASYNREVAKAQRLIRDKISKLRGEAYD